MPILLILKFLKIFYIEMTKLLQYTHGIYFLKKISNLTYI